MDAPLPPTLAVQIVNYRTRAHLERCLVSVLADLEGGELAFEVNLLDNDSGEPLDDLAARHPAVRAHTSARNLGFGGGHNQLAGLTTAAYLWILNPDVELFQARTAARLLDVLAGPGDVRAAGPRLLTADGRPQRYDHGRLTGPRAQIAIRGGHSYWRATDRQLPVAWANGAALMIDHAAFTALGGFDENLFLYKEEEDLCLRLRATGASVRYVPEVSIRHVGQVVADRDHWRPRAEAYYIAKHFPGRSQRVFAAIHHGLAYLHR